MACRGRRPRYELLELGEELEGAAGLVELAQAKVDAQAAEQAGEAGIEDAMQHRDRLALVPVQDLVVLLDQVHAKKASLFCL